jgi:hypothetical protein
MNPPRVDDDAFDRLVADMLHGIAATDSVALLERVLRADAGRRAQYVDRALFHAQLAATPLAAGVSRRASPSRPASPPAAARGAGSRTGRPSRRSIGVLFGGGLAIVAAAAVTIALGLRRPDEATPWADGITRTEDRWIADGAIRSPSPGGYDTRQLPAQWIGMLATPSTDDRPLPRTSLAAGGQASRLRTACGVDVEVDATGVFGLVSGRAGALFTGGMRARLSGPEQSYSVEAANLRVVDLGTEFRVRNLGADRVEVTVLDGEVEVQSRARLPLVHWSFASPATGSSSSDSETGRVGDARGHRDAIQGLEAVAGPAIRPAGGAVDGAAVAFDNTGGSYLRVEGGTGERVGTGLFSFSTGISIEAVVTPAWSGKAFDYDEIWRKEDGDSRVLLSFQNDAPRNAAYSVPAVPGGPCLAFGLQLTQPGASAPRYDELDMPLDGREGRPTLADLVDGRPHHVVATFDSFSGRKAIFLDGRLRFSHVYPEGSLIVSGGPEPAFIGSHRGGENFTGSLDELALYDFALSSEEVAEHGRGLTAGRRVTPTVHLVVADPGEHDRHWRVVSRLETGQSAIFNRLTGLPADGIPGLPPAARE